MLQYPPSNNNHHKPVILGVELTPLEVRRYVHYFMISKFNDVINKFLRRFPLHMYKYSYTFTCQTLVFEVLRVLVIPRNLDFISYSLYKKFSIIQFLWVCHLICTYADFWIINFSHSQIIRYLHVCQRLD
jgi:hypothetical protein